MLAKVFKNQGAVAFKPLAIPELGAPKPVVEGVGAFAFPTLDSFVSQPEPIAQVEAFAPIAAAPSIEDVLVTARQEAAQIVAQAEQHSELIETIARENAMVEARRVVEAENAAQVDAMRQNLTETISQISSLSGVISERVEGDVVELALEIAKKIVGREVMFDRDIALTLVKISLKKLHSRAVAEVRLHPEDFAYVQANRGRLDFHGSLDIVEDRSISPGGCLIHTETGDVDGRIESQFEEIAHGLLGS